MSSTFALCFGVAVNCESAARIHSWCFLGILVGLSSCGGRLTETAPSDVDSGPEVSASEPRCGAVVPSVACPSTSEVATCPGGSCMAQAIPSDGRSTFRIAFLHFERNIGLLPDLDFSNELRARCMDKGSEALNWVFEIDRSRSTLRTGPAVSSDGKRYSLLDTKVTSNPDALCPGFAGTENLEVRPVEAVARFGPNGYFGSDPIPYAALTIASPAGTVAVLRLHDLVLSGWTSAGDTCIGRWNAPAWCGATQGWTSLCAGISAKILVEDAERMPLPSSKCRSVCSVLADAKHSDGLHCVRGADGAIGEIGDACVGGTGCKNAFEVRAAYGAYAVALAK